MKTHIKGDGNGGLYVSKPFALISIALTIIIFLSSAVFSYGALNTRVDSIEQCCDNKGEQLLVLDDKLHTQDTDIAVLKQNIKNIDNNIQEIKEILKG